MFDDDYSPEVYKPVPQVVAAHNIPHLTQSLSSADNTFKFYDSSGSLNNEYFMSTAGLPIIIIVLGVLSILIYQLTLCMRCCCLCCCNCCKIPTVANKPDEKGGIFWTKTFRHYPKLMTCFHIALVAAFVADFCIYFGNGYLTKAFHEGGDAMESLAKVFSDVVSAGDGLVDAADALSAALVSPSCSAIYSQNNAELSDQVGSFRSSSGKLTDVVGSFPDKILDARHTFLSYGPKKDQILFLYFAFILFFLLCFLVVPCCGSKWALNTLIFFTELVIITLVIISGVEMVLVILLGDFCMSPADSVLSILNNGSSTDLLSYYLKCEGENEFFKPLNNATTAVTSFNGTMYDTVADIRTQTGNNTLGEVCLQTIETQV